MRDKCQSPVSCRKYLGSYTNGVNHSCQNDTFICAQCGGNHFSLDSICPVVKKYREELKLAVDKALASGAIKRSAPGEVSRPFQQQTNDFPLLNQGQVISRPAWTTSDNGSLHSNLKQEMSDLVVTIKALSETMIRTEKSFNDLNNRIEVQHKSTILHCNSICAIIDTVQIMSSWVQEEWYSNSTLDSVLTKWENNPCPLPNQFIPLNILTYNVQGWGTRALEVMDLIFKVDSPVCVFTEVEELWNSFKVPHFTSFYQKGTNHSGGVMITIGKHLRATRIDTGIENTVIVDIHGLSEQIRIIGIYWPQGQMRNLKDLCPFLVKGTILTGDFNATSDEWGSQSTDRRGCSLKKWIEENELTFIPTNSHSSKRSDRHIDLTFTNLNRVENETIFYGSSDRWPTVLRSQSIGFISNGFFPNIDWTIYQTILVRLEDFWINEQKKETIDIDLWYQCYDLAKDPEIDPLNAHDIQIETEFRDLQNLLTASKGTGLEATSITEVSKNVFLWDNFHKQAKDGVGHLFMLKRVKHLKLKHRSLLLDWLDFNEQSDN
ncbi:unnamed protein product [Rotaria magnacalcarata]|uniref:Endonuclease/exonuclease/phosphatase domain-containing protein n=1 Tax=Rotaria magnacalcarata TaxID=392030 RepID=A0A8S2QXJ9_9BILA|nr:unnamed protein product [Rotaria magnacalcarata]CAF4163554.1 unnamed protein product [Rotaria magnacalcarata]